MQPEDQIRIRHLVDAATTVRQFVEGRNRSDLDSDEMLRLARGPDQPGVLGTGADGSLHHGFLMDLLARELTNC